MDTVCRKKARSAWALLSCENGLVLSFQPDAAYRPPQWRDAAHPQQLRLDVLVDDLDVAQALALGARLLEGSEKPVGFRVYADPAGHPFCLSTN